MSASESPVPSGWREVLHQIDENHTQAHERLRLDFRGLQATVESNYRYFDNMHKLHFASISALGAKVDTPVDATKLMVSTRVVVGIVTAVLVIVGSAWASTWGLRSDVRDILTRMEAQQRATDARDKLLDVQAQATKDQAQSLKIAMDDMRRRQELQQYEIGELSKAILRSKQ